MWTCAAWTTRSLASSHTGSPTIQTHPAFSQKCCLDNKLIFQERISPPVSPLLAVLSRWPKLRYQCRHRGHKRLGSIFPLPYRHRYCSIGGLTVSGPPPGGLPLVQASASLPLSRAFPSIDDVQSQGFDHGFGVYIYIYIYIYMCVCVCVCV
jgi:hypothetical protein